MILKNMIVLQCLLAQQVRGFSTGGIARSFQHRTKISLFDGSYGLYPTQTSCRPSQQLFSTATSNNEEKSVIPITILSGFLGRFVSICDVQFCAYDVHTKTYVSLFLTYHLTL